MNAPRRRLLRLAGVGALGALAGCFAPNDSTDPGNGTTDGSAGVTAAETARFVTRGSPPQWYFDGDVGRVILVDSDERERAALAPYDVTDERRDRLRELRSGIDYDDERLLLVESVGPNACYDRLELSGIRVDEGSLRAEATVLDTSEGDVACAQVEQYPSALARVGFDGDPPDSVAVDITDGRGDTAAVSATVTDRLAPDLDSLDGAIRPETDPDPIDPLDCDRSGVDRHYQGFEASEATWGTTEADGRPVFALRIEDTEFRHGDTVRIRLTNVADRIVATGNSAKYNLQALTTAGWQDVRVGDEDRYFEYTDEAISHPPGGGFEWSFELTETGLVDGAFHDHATVCPDLSSGRYRFVFWGAIGGAVAVAFDLV